MRAHDGSALLDRHGFRDPVLVAVAAADPELVEVAELVGAAPVVGLVLEDEGVQAVPAGGAGQDDRSGPGVVQRVVRGQLVAAATHRVIPHLTNSRVSQ